MDFILSANRLRVDPIFNSVFENEPNSHRKWPNFRAHISKLYQGFSYNYYILLIRGTYSIKSFKTLR